MSAAARSPTTGGPTAATRPTPRDRSGCVRFSGAVRSSRPSSMRPSMPSGQTRRRKRSAATGARCRNSCGGAGTGRLTTPRGQKIPKKSPKNSQIRGVKNTHPQIFGGEDISTPKKRHLHPNGTTPPNTSSSQPQFSSPLLPQSPLGRWVTGFQTGQIHQKQDAYNDGVRYVCIGEKREGADREK